MVSTFFGFLWWWLNAKDERNKYLGMFIHAYVIWKNPYEGIPFIFEVSPTFKRPMTSIYVPEKFSVLYFPQPDVPETIFSFLSGSHPFRDTCHAVRELGAQCRPSRSRLEGGAVLCQRANSSISPHFLASQHTCEKINADKLVVIDKKRKKERSRLITVWWAKAAYSSSSSWTPPGNIFYEWWTGASSFNSPTQPLGLVCPRPWGRTYIKK